MANVARGCSLFGGQSAKQWLPIIWVFLVPVDYPIRQVDVEKRFVVCVFIERLAVLTEQLESDAVILEIEITLMKSDGCKRFFHNHFLRRRVSGVKVSD